MDSKATEESARSGRDYETDPAGKPLSKQRTRPKINIDIKTVKRTGTDLKMAKPAPMIDVENKDNDVASTDMMKVEKMDLLELKPVAPAPFGINVIAE